MFASNGEGRSAIQTSQTVFTAIKRCLELVYFHLQTFSAEDATPPAVAPAVAFAIHPSAVAVSNAMEIDQSTAATSQKAPSIFRSFQIWKVIDIVRHFQFLACYMREWQFKNESNV